MIGDLVRDAVIGVRQLRRRPTQSVALLATLALGIGATTAVFGVMRAVLLRPLPFDEPERLVAVWSTRPAQGVDQLAVSDEDFAAFRERTRTLAAVEATLHTSFDIERDGFVERTQGRRVSAGMLPMLGVRMVAGRAFAAAEGGADPARVVLVGENEWRSRYGGDPAFLGSTLRLDGEPHTVIGILPHPLPLAGIGGTSQVEYWAPLGQVGGRGLAVTARLKPGATRASALADLAAIARDRERESAGTNDGIGVRVVGLHEQTVGRAEEPLRLLGAVVAFVLLVASANAANLLLGRSAERGREMAVRAALGAGRFRLVRQMLHETLVVAAVAGELGVLLASWATDLLVARMPAQLPRAEDTRIDGVVLLFAAATALLSVLVAGLVPALRASRSRPMDGITRGGRAGAAPGRVRALTAGTQIALAVVLAACAALLLRSLLGLANVDVGIDANGVIAVDARAGSALDTGAGRQAFMATAAAELDALPGIEATAVITPLPFSGTNVRLQAVEPVSGDSQMVHLRAASPGWLDVVRLTLRRGRFIEPTDVAGGEPVAVVSETTARRLWPDRDALGRRVRMTVGLRPVEWRVVGVIADERVDGPAQPPPPLVYVPFAQDTPLRFAHVVVRHDGRRPLPMDDLRRRVGTAAPGQPIGPPVAVGDLLAATFAATRFYTFLLGVFAGVALLLATIGIYGANDQSVAQQRSELGIRQAVGASRADVARLVFARGLVVVGIGTVAGIAGAAMSSRLLESLLFGVRPADPLLLALAGTVVAGAALLAISLPARRAANLEPLQALRDPS